jgi:hypothetical protein
MIIATYLLCSDTLFESLGKYGAEELIPYNASHIMLQQYSPLVIFAMPNLPYEARSFFPICAY